MEIRMLVGLWNISMIVIEVCRVLLSEGVIRLRSSGGSHLWVTIVHPRELTTVLTSELLVAELIGRGLEVLLVEGRSLLFRLNCTDTAVAAVEADAVVVVHDDGLGVDVVNVDDVDVVHAAVVGEDTMIPTAALIADAAVTEAVVDAAVEADVRAPVTGVKDVCATSPAPVTGGPENTGGRRLNPDTRNPVVALGTPCPVARRPDISLAGA